MSSPRLRVCLAAVALSAALTACGSNRDARNHLGYEEGVAPVEGLSLIEGLALYLLAPLAIVLVLAALVWLPGMMRSSRYRPGKPWTAAPLWFGGPPDPAAAVENAETGDVVRGGASGDW